MLTAAARASLRRVAVSLPLRPLTAPLAARAPAALLARPFSATPRPAEAAAKKTPAKAKKAPAKQKPAAKKAAPKKKKKPAAKKKAVPRRKKALTPEQKAKAKIAALKETALFTEPAKLPAHPWLLFVSKEQKGKIVGDEFTSVLKVVAEKFRALPPSELERLKSECESNRTANAASYKAWVESHTPDQIHDANLARLNLVRRGVTRGVPMHGKAARKIHDERLPKKPSSAYSLFIKDRWNAGNFSGEVISKATEMANMWRALSETEKNAYREKAAAAQASYVQERKAVMERDL